MPPSATSEVASKDGGADWSRCAAGFVAAADPIRTIERLGVSCGPSNGMLRQPPRASGALSDEGDEGAYEWHGLARHCYRLVVATSGVADLEVEVAREDGGSVALVNTEASWALVPAQAPLCPDRNERYNARVRTHGGKGRYAMDLWRLP